MVGILFFVRCLSIVSLCATVAKGNDPLEDVPASQQCSQCTNVLEKGFTFSGGDKLRDVNNVSTWSECRRICTNDNSCQHWTIHKQTYRCFLYSSIRGDRNESAAFISGNRACGAIVIAATADFTQNNLCGFKAPRLRGHRLENGDFIFSWQRGSRKMVLTDSLGVVKKWGAVQKQQQQQQQQQHETTTWRDPNTWITYDNRRYTVSNFRGQTHDSVCNCTEILENNINYPSTNLDDIGNILTWEECRNLCTDKAGCAVFSYWTDHKRCYMKTKKTYEQDYGGFISGTAACYPSS